MSTNDNENDQRDTETDTTQESTSRDEHSQPDQEPASSASIPSPNSQPTQHGDLTQLLMVVGFTQEEIEHFKSIMPLPLSTLTMSMIGRLAARIADLENERIGRETMGRIVTPGGKPWRN